MFSKRTEVNEVGDGGVDFFADFARDGFAAAFAEFDAPADGPIEGFVLVRIVAA